MVTLALIIAVAAVSTAAPLIRAAEPAPALTVASLRIVIAALILTAVAGRSMTLWRDLSGRERLAIVLAGVLLACHFASWVSSLYLTSVAASVALVATQPIFAAVLGRFFLREVISAREAAGIAVAGVGCIVLAGGDLARGDALLGDGLAVVGALTAAGYLVVGRRLRTSLPLAPYLAMVNLVAGVVLLVMALSFGSPLSGFETEVYGAIALAALIPSILGHSLLNWSVRRAPAHLVALFILGEPVGASLLTWFAQGEKPPLSAVVGGLVILAGIGVGFAAHGPRAAKAAEPDA